MNSKFMQFGFIIMILSGIFGTAFAHEHGNGDSLKADPNYFPRQESCPKDFFWQTVVNKTPFNVRIFIDGKPFSTEIYALNPGYQATRCFPEGKHEIKIIAFVYEKMPFSNHGRIEILKAEREFSYDSAENDKPAALGFMEIEENNLNPIAIVSFKNARHNSGIVFLVLFILFALSVALMIFRELLRFSKNFQDN